MKMQKNKKIIIALAVALVCAIIACIVVFVLVTPSRTTIYVFNDSYAAGTQISGEMLSPLQVDSTMVSSGANTATSEQFMTTQECRDAISSGQSLRIDVTEGLPLMDSMLSVTGGNSIEMAMQSNAIAVTVSVDGVTGVTDELSAGSRVNVYATYNSTGTSLLLENMRILNTEKTSDGSLVSATLEVNNSQALRLIEAANRGNIYLGIVDGNGYQYVDEANDAA